MLRPKCCLHKVITCHRLASSCEVPSVPITLLMAVVHLFLEEWMIFGDILEVIFIITKDL